MPRTDPSRSFAPLWHTTARSCEASAPRLQAQQKYRLAPTPWSRRVREWSGPLPSTPPDPHRPSPTSTLAASIPTPIAPTAAGRHALCPLWMRDGRFVCHSFRMLCRDTDSGRDIRFETLFSQARQTHQLPPTAHSTATVKPHRSPAGPARNPIARSRFHARV
jgi:hypothetical protein